MVAVMTYDVRGELKRDLKVTTIVTGAHTTNHFLQLVLPPLFPLLKVTYGVSYTDLGLLMALFYVASGLCQTPAGFLVDRFGARRVLVGGLATLSCAIILIGIVPTFTLMFPLMVIAGVGNSVFHPADYSLMTASVSKHYLARAYGVHTFGGNLGWALAPMIILGLSALVGWRTALAFAGLFGLLIATFVFVSGGVLLEESELLRRKGGSRGPMLKGDIVLLFSTPILLCFVYFALLSVALVGIQTFLPATLHALRGTSLTAAGVALTAYLAGSASGILAGGFAADRTRAHERVVALGLASAAALLLAVGSIPFPDFWLAAALAAAGFAAGFTMPSRDMLARGATPSGATGKVFGFIYSGLDLGSAITPIILGLLLDRRMPLYVFVVSAAALALAIVTTFGIKRTSLSQRNQPRPIIRSSFKIREAAD
jgi:MFS transporter, FSR family, fosmidomycin resistance protein